MTDEAAAVSPGLALDELSHSARIALLALLLIGTLAFLAIDQASNVPSQNAWPGPDKKRAPSGAIFMWRTIRRSLSRQRPSLPPSSQPRRGQSILPLMACAGRADRLDRRKCSFPLSFIHREKVSLRPNRSQTSFDASIYGRAGGLVSSSRFSAFSSATTSESVALRMPSRSYSVRAHRRSRPNERRGRENSDPLHVTAIKSSMTLSD